MHECKDHLQDRIDAFQNKIARRLQWKLEECAKLQAVVDHSSQAKSCEIQTVNINKPKKRIVNLTTLKIKITKERTYIILVRLNKNKGTNSSNSKEETSMAVIILRGLAPSDRSGNWSSLQLHDILLLLKTQKN